MVNEEVAGTFNLPDGVDEDNLVITGKANVTPNIQNLNGEKIDLSKIQVSYQGGGDFMLGNYHISESMAYIGEEIMYGGGARRCPALSKLSIRSGQAIGQFLFSRTQ